MMKKSEKVYRLSILLMVISLAVLGYCFYAYQDSWEACEIIDEHVKRLEMYEEQTLVDYYDTFNSTIVQGYYSSDLEYYAVYIGDRNIREVYKTDYHEVCHALVHHYNEHFCHD